jgi:hypothetical protein
LENEKGAEVILLTPPLLCAFSSGSLTRLRTPFTLLGYTRVLGRVPWTAVPNSARQPSFSSFSRTPRFSSRASANWMCYQPSPSHFVSYIICSQDYWVVGHSSFLVDVSSSRRRHENRQTTTWLEDIAARQWLRFSSVPGRRRL